MIYTDNNNIIINFLDLSMQRDKNRYINRYKIKYINRYKIKYINRYKIKYINSIICYCLNT